jgi:hypothetical protein
MEGQTAPPGARSAAIRARVTVNRRGRDSLVTGGVPLNGRRWYAFRARAVSTLMWSHENDMVWPSTPVAPPPT